MNDDKSNPDSGMVAILPVVTPEIPIFPNGADVDAVGRLVFAFQYLESEILRILIDSCMPGKETAIAILASQLPFRKLVVAFQAIVDGLSHNDATKELARNFAGHVAIIEADRNRYIHSHYDIKHMSIKGQAIMRRKHNMSVKKGFSENEEWFKPSDIDVIIDRIMAAADELHAAELALITESIIPEIV